MGGAPRNWFLEKPAKDIDVFVKCNTPLSTSNFCGYSVREIKQTEFYSSKPDIVAVYETITDGEKVQFIFVRFKPSWSKFPYSTSKAKMLSDGTVVVSEDFVLSHQHKIHVITGALYANKNYLFKMKEYFPDYRMVSKEQAYNYFFCKE
jgi:hypothetical protein